MKISKLIMFVSLSVMTTLAQAAVFSDDFNGYGVAVPWTIPTGGWSYQGEGNVDLVANNSYGISIGNADGFFVDLNGSPGTTTFQNTVGGLTLGQMYNLTFDLAGNHRDTAFNDSVTVKFGTSSNIFAVADTNADFTHFSLSFIATGSSADISFMDNYTNGDRRIGTLLDNVSVTAVPEPEVYGLMLIGLGLVGFVSRRRKNQRA